MPVMYSPICLTCFLNIYCVPVSVLGAEDAMQKIKINSADTSSCPNGAYVYLPFGKTDKPVHKLRFQGGIHAIKNNTAGWENGFPPPTKNIAKS